ncbi:MAG: phosphoglucosamine mutase [Actinobacteria bacterium]|nr:phosphoglucosamine mutase [Actinomycetota bacterium]
MARLFGTDGVRGLANRELTADLAMGLGSAAVRVLTASGNRSGRPLAVVGRDPRASGEFLEAALVAGLASAGADVAIVGVEPTPAVAFLTAHLGADLGVMISASHNAMPDNGIKFFSRGGHKLADDLEDQIESVLAQTWDRPVGASVGRVRTESEASATYLEHLLSTVSTSLSGIRVVVDCANGAASRVAPEALRRAGAEVIAIHASPDGLNINDGCGSTHMSDLIAAVRDNKADVGIAHDGDADRCLAVDAHGVVVDGDQILAILSLSMRERGVLASDTVVATVMSNLGFHIAMREAGISVEQAGVGDRYVLEAMRAGSYSLGGEQSGHVIMSDHATTGDGVLTALHVLERMSVTGSSLEELAGVMTRLPQVLINVSGVDKTKMTSSPELAEAVALAEAELGSSGRVLLRPSGTEPLVRVMVEAVSADQAQQVAERLAASVRALLSL